MLNCVFVTFPCGILGQVWYLIVLIPDLCPFYYIVPSNMHCPVFYFVILLENIVVRQRSNFIQFIHISLIPDLFHLNIKSYPTLIIIGFCFGVRGLVMIRLMCVHFTLSSVWAAEWPPFEKYLHTRLAICSHCILVYLYFLLLIILVLRARCGF